MREATLQEKTLADVGPTEVSTTGKQPLITPGLKEAMNRAALRNILRKQKGFSRQTRSREFPNYQPYENRGGGMNRHYERAAQKEADEALSKRVFTVDTAPEDVTNAILNAEVPDGLPTND